MKPKKNQAGSIYEAQGMDACQTPSYAVTPLLSYLHPYWKVWEPAAGAYHLVDALRANEQEVYPTDLLTGDNFFDYTPMYFDAIVTNPPYSIKYPWIERCCELGKPFALLVPLETMGAKGLQKLWDQYDFRFLLFSDRIDFKMPEKGWDSHAQFPVCWLTWNILPQQIVRADIIDAKKAFKKAHRNG